MIRRIIKAIRAQFYSLYYRLFPGRDPLRTDTKNPEVSLGGVVRMVDDPLYYAPPSPTMAYFAAVNSGAKVVKHDSPLQFEVRLQDSLDSRLRRYVIADKATGEVFEVSASRLAVGCVEEERKLIEEGIERYLFALSPRGLESSRPRISGLFRGKVY